MNELSWAWLAVAIAMFVIEGFTVNLISVWFGIGALFSMLAAIFGLSLWWTVLIFVLISALLLISTKPLTKRFVKKIPTNIDSLIGEKGIVSEAIDPLSGVGQVKLNGVVWSAKTEQGEKIDPGSLVEVVAVQGVKLVVK